MTTMPTPLSDDDLEQVSGGVAGANRITDLLNAEGSIPHGSVPSPGPWVDSNGMAQSLALIMQTSMPSADLDTLLVSIAQKMREADDNASHGKIESDQEKLKQSLEDRQAKIDEAMSKIEEVKAKSNSAHDQNSPIWQLQAALGPLMAAFQAAEAKGDTHAMAANSKQMEGLMQMLDGQIDTALQRLMQNGQNFNTMLDQITDSIKDKGDTLSKAKFRP
jgi:hypothetical protein